MKNLIYLILLTGTLTSCGKSPIGELVAISASYQQESHTSRQAGEDLEEIADIEAIEELISESQDLGIDNDNLSAKNGISKKQLVCATRKISKDLNNIILSDRKIYASLISKKRKFGNLSRSEEVELARLLIKYRLLGPNNYYYHATKYSAEAIEEKTKAQAIALIQQNKIPEICTYTVRTDNPKMRYARVSYEITSSECSEEFSKRAQILAPGMVASAAALESGWGTSRFAKQGNNFFGIQQRFNDLNEFKVRNCIAAGNDKHRCLYKFASLKDSIIEYYRVLNAGTYQPAFRESRSKYEFSTQMSCLQASSMIEGLVNYAENPHYVQHVNERLKLVCSFECDE